jgi:hypothetical protein
MIDFPLVIEFAPRTRVLREREVASKLPIVQNGPPGSFVVFADGSKVALPTDQIVEADDSGGAARVTFGGMSFAGLEDGQLVFHRVREIRPEALLSPERGRRMALAPRMVTAILAGEREVWRRGVPDLQ